jgi:hypothetical protein
VSVVPWGMVTAKPVTPFDPVLDALDRAPIVRLLTPEQRAELDQAVEDIDAGRVQLIDQDDVPAWLEARARGQHGVLS